MDEVRLAFEAFSIYLSLQRLHPIPKTWGWYASTLGKKGISAP